MSKFAILLGGDVTPTARLGAQLEEARVIAADSGMTHAAKLGLTPELWVGDFDSAGIALETEFAQIPRHVFPTAKDATDGAIAVQEALSRGATSLLLVGGFGGQVDHVLAHVMQLVPLHQAGIGAILTSGHEEAHVLTQSLAFFGLEAGTRLSVVPLTPLKGLSLQNVRWPLTNRDVTLGDTLTLSNETTGDATLSLGSGLALVVVYPS